MLQILGSYAAGPSLRDFSTINRHRSGINGRFGIKIPEMLGDLCALCIEEVPKISASSVFDLSCARRYRSGYWCAAATRPIRCQRSWIRYQWGFRRGGACDRCGSCIESTQQISASSACSPFKISDAAKAAKRLGAPRSVGSAFGSTHG